MEEKFGSLTAKAGEYFEDYLIIVRCKEGTAWKSSDSSWGLGAARRYIKDIEDRDRFNLFKMIQTEGE